MSGKSESNEEQEKILILPSQRGYVYKFSKGSSATQIGNKIRQGGIKKEIFLDKEKIEKIISDRKYIARSKSKKEKLSDKYDEIILKEFVDSSPKEFIKSHVKVKRKAPPLRPIVKTMNVSVDHNEWDILLMLSDILENSLTEEERDMRIEHYKILEKAAKITTENKEFSSTVKLFKRAFLLRKNLGHVTEDFANNVFNVAIETANTETIFGYELSNADRLFSVAIDTYFIIGEPPVEWANKIEHIMDIAIEEKEFIIVNRLSGKIIKMGIENKELLLRISGKIERIIKIALIEKDFKSVNNLYEKIIWIRTKTNQLSVKLARDIENVASIAQKYEYIEIAKKLFKNANEIKEGLK